MASARDFYKLLNVWSFFRQRIKLDPAQLSLWVKYRSEPPFFWK